MKPITKTDIEEYDELLKQRTEEINAKLDELSTKITVKPKEEKIEDIIKKMKEKIPERIIRKPEIPREEVEIPKEEIKVKEKVEQVVKEHSHDDDVFCPTCNKGHVHKLDSSGLTMKCTDGKCGEKFYVIPESADYTCDNCGFPLKKPENDKTLDSCPFCKNDMAHPFINGKPIVKFDFSKLKK